MYLFTTHKRNPANKHVLFLLNSILGHYPSSSSLIAFFFMGYWMQNKGASVSSLWLFNGILSMGAGAIYKCFSIPYSMRVISLFSHEKYFWGMRRGELCWNRTCSTYSIWWVWMRRKPCHNQDSQPREPLVSLHNPSPSTFVARTQHELYSLKFPAVQWPH